MAEKSDRYLKSPESLMGARCKTRKSLSTYHCQVKVLALNKIMRAQCKTRKRLSTYHCQVKVLSTQQANGSAMQDKEEPVNISLSGQSALHSTR